ncbi:MAG: universal stress protein [Desulfocapsaceae bacterium]|nr:universal stress protein [Desulfocapsaceae bacterium]
MKILVGYKETSIGRELLDLAIHRVKAHSGEIHVVTSLFGDEGTELISEAEKNLDYAHTYLEEKGVKNQIHLLIRGRNIGEDLVDFAQENDVDEIVIAVKSRSRVGKLLFSPTAQYVILKSPCPVTSVK